MKRFLRLPSPAMAVALVALFTALAGSAYAATVITGSNVRNGSLTGADLKNGTLGEKQIGEGKVEGSDIKNGALAARDIKPGSLTANLFPAGALPKGDKGDKGDTGPSRWLIVNADGQIEAQSGGFTVKSGYVGNPAGATDNVYIDAGEDLSNNGIAATINLQNQVNQLTPDPGTPPNGRRAGADNNPEFSGEISATRCAITGVVSCAPPGTNTNTHFVVSPRNSDGSATAPGTRKRFSVVISGN